MRRVVKRLKNKPKLLNTNTEPNHVGSVFNSLLCMQYYGLRVWWEGSPLVLRNGGKNPHPFFFPTLLPLLYLIKYEATPRALWGGVDGSTPIASGKMCGHSDMLLHCKLCFQFQKFLKFRKGFVKKLPTACSN